jgi:hypothetical protein
MKRRHKYCRLDFRDAPLGRHVGDITVNGEPGAISSSGEFQDVLGGKPRRGTVGHHFTLRSTGLTTVDYAIGWMSHDDYPYETHVGRYGTESYDLRCSDRAGYLGLQSIGLVPCDECVPACNP